MVTNQNHSSDASREQEVIRYTKILAQAFGLNEQNAEVHSEIRYNGIPINRNWPYTGTFSGTKSHILKLI